MAKTLEDYLKVIDYVENDLIELTSDKLDMIFDGLKSKVDSYCEISQYMKDRSEALKSRANELLKKSKALENSEKNLKAHMAHLMMTNDCLELQGNDYIAKVKTLESLKMKRDPLESEAIDYPLFIRQKIVYEWNKNEIKKVIAEMPNFFSDIAEIETKKSINFKVKK